MVPLHLNPPPLLLKLFSIRLKPCENFCYFFLSLSNSNLAILGPVPRISRDRKIHHVTNRFPSAFPGSPPARG
ncbi:hypothetical protein IM40_06740 [Candidatus Paracaedimonas acanthamoebae]|nr:hypothetical protein IM40_06740 [Candidatus Paracaedimonas acanthamoebae]